jgi:acyl dehydratase
MGVVHVRNQITQHRPIADDETLSLECWVEGHDEARLGWEFGLVTEVRVGAELVWQSVSTALSRRKGKPGPRPKRAEEEAPPPGGRSAVWSLPEDLGRRYGRVSGDYNPIHMYSWTAKAFGFKRAIIHGMWSLARSVAELDDDLPEGPVTVDVAFVKPILLPSRVLFDSTRSAEGVDFSVRNAKDARVRLTGRCVAGVGDPVR